MIVKRGIYVSLIKPFADKMLAIVAFVVILPFFIVVALLLMWDVGNPFFTQERVGCGLRVFRIIKFRTMNSRRDARGNLLPDVERLTSLGRMVRKASLDEIPQLLNVIKGDMSLIGPRPLLVQYVPIYSTEQIRRHEVKPGISGWAQIHGRNAISWAEKFKYDVWYVDHVSLLVDLKILLITIVKVFKAEGISGRNVATAEFFNGRN